MSKSVRLKDHLVTEVERLAKEERRSLAQMVELLLEQALRLPSPPTVTVTPEMKKEIDSAPARPVGITPFSHPQQESGVKTDFKPVRK